MMASQLSGISALLDEYQELDGPQLEKRRKLLDKAKALMKEYLGPEDTIFERYDLDGAEKTKFLDVQARWTRYDGILTLNPSQYGGGERSGGGESYLKSMVAAARSRGILPPGKPKKTAHGFFAYDGFYPGQAEGIEAVRASASQGGVLLLNSPTGTGKTAMALAGLLNAAQENEKVVVLTRTHSQYNAFLKEAKALNRAGFRVPCGFLQGKEKVCPAGVGRHRCAAAQVRARQMLKRGSATPSRGGYLREAAARLRQGSLGFGCPYYVNTYERSLDGAMALRAGARGLVGEQHRAPLGPDEFLRECSDREYPLCPYEAMKHTLVEARLLVLHYLYFIDPEIRGMMYEQGWIGCLPAEAHVLIDEAHNIGQIVVEQNAESFELADLAESVRFLEEAVARSGDFDLSAQAEDVGRAVHLLSSVEESVRHWFDGRVLKSPGFGGEDLLLESEKVDADAWLTWDGSPAFSLDDGRMLCLEKAAKEINKQFEGLSGADELPELFDRPIVCDVARVLGMYLRLFGDRHVKYVRCRRLEQPTLGEPSSSDYSLVIGVCDIDPRDRLSELAKSSRSLTLMSGTLSPAEMFRHLLFLADVAVRTHEMGNPFPKENRAVAVVTDATSAYTQRRSPANVAAVGRVIGALASVKGNVGVFFPSYDFLESYRQTCASLCEAHGKRLYVEERSADKDAIIRGFKSGADAMMAGVCRGSFSEGIDYPGQEMRAVAVVGVPLAQPSRFQKRVQEYYDRRGLDGQTLTYNLPAVIAATQALGRCIRSESDRGVLILADGRFLLPKYGSLLPKWVREEALPVLSERLAALLAGKLA
jgi:DNA excision repair protein ERCC-2